ncbi:hypothetical protein [Bradyrhizobium japonicum]|uniref:hypothetical protein n=1 Tax=Bradyrhizobium japonicum TaxID=375 RepID=UPI00054FEE78
MPRARLLDDGKYRDSRIAKYLNDALMTEDTAVIVKAIGDMIRAQGSSSFSRKSSLRRESLYRSVLEAHVLGLRKDAGSSACFGRQVGSQAALQMILGGTEATAETGAFFRSRVGARDVFPESYSLLPLHCL